MAIPTCSWDSPKVIEGTYCGFKDVYGGHKKNSIKRQWRRHKIQTPQHPILFSGTRYLDAMLGLCYPGDFVKIQYLGRGKGSRGIKLFRVSIQDGEWARVIASANNHHKTMGWTFVSLIVAKGDVRIVASKEEDAFRQMIRRVEAKAA